MDWVGLDQTGLCCIMLYCVVLCWVGLSLTGMDWAELDWAGFALSLLRQASFLSRYAKLCLASLGLVLLHQVLEGFVKGIVLDIIQAGFFKIFGVSWFSYSIHASTFNSALFHLFRLCKGKKEKMLESRPEYAPVKLVKTVETVEQIRQRLQRLQRLKRL